MIKIRGRIVSFKPLNLFHHELKNDRLIGQITIFSKKEVTPLLLRVENDKNSLPKIEVIAAVSVVFTFVVAITAFLNASLLITTSPFAR